MTHFVRAALLAATVSATLSAQAPAPQQLDTIRVTSRIAPDAGAAQRSVESIGREAIDRLPARTVTDLLEMAFGADVQRRSPAQADLAIRGSSLGQVLVLVNGVRVSDLQTGHFDLDLAVPLDAVARIEILRGPGATLYGPDAIGGVVNVVTRQGEAWARARG
ncbi:MAG TPA: TonB-dependent receptor plug domain-containing protein, partial [Gemmatimonadaceae bacterium]|nr:TonB-dependent receptor plug domain-containing protein [Gemmatimonadaceae bacterium]